MGRPRDEDYYTQSRTEHVAQGDIFRDVEFDLPEGDASFTGYGMLLLYTSGMMDGPPGTRGYAHDFRLIAPIFTFSMISDLGFTDQQLEHIRGGDTFGRLMYLPPYVGEWGESVVIPYRAVQKQQRQLDGRRVTQLQLPAAQQLQRKIARAFLGRDFEEDPDPDMTDHWNPR